MMLMMTIHTIQTDRHAARNSLHPCWRQSGNALCILHSDKYAIRESDCSSYFLSIHYVNMDIKN